jgi:hypothetical protein
MFYLYGLFKNTHVYKICYMKKILVIAMISLGLWTGCSKISNSNSSYTPTCTGAVKSYKTDVAPIISTYCSGCHSNFSTYASLSADKSNVSAMIESGNMPRGSSLSTAQKDAVICWISSGAPNN